uniref:Uncharacterized protein n=1 Tax=Cacopsylla melanoneura TaxID=428564 RepID=A0A8D8SWQ8_9HEMI
MKLLKLSQRNTRGRGEHNDDWEWKPGNTGKPFISTLFTVIYIFFSSREWFTYCCLCVSFSTSTFLCTLICSDYFIILFLLHFLIHSYAFLPSLKYRIPCLCFPSELSFSSPLRFYYSFLILSVLLSFPFPPPLPPSPPPSLENHYSLPCYLCRVLFTLHYFFLSSFFLFFLPSFYFILCSRYSFFLCIALLLILLASTFCFH